ncbi:MAG: tetratricopeptide repeat protein [Candidatus Zixiibacteriota bacterium]
MTQPVTNSGSSGFCPGITDGLALLDLARGWLAQGNPVVASELLGAALRTDAAKEDRSMRGRILKETGRARMMQSQWDEAESTYSEAQCLFADLDDLRGVSECARNRANMSFQRGQYTQSEQLCEEALKYASQLGDYELRATVLNTIGAIKSATGQSLEAVKTLRLCLTDFRTAGNVLRQGYVLLNIGLTQTELSECDEAIKSLNQALAIALDKRDLNLVEICYQSIAKCYLAQKETTLARSVVDTARRILPGLNSRALETELNLIECRILRLMGHTDAALKLADQTLKMAVDHDLAALQADLLFEQGLLYKQSGQTDLAITKLDASINQFRAAGVERGFKEAIRALEGLKRNGNGKQQ